MRACPNCGGEVQDAAIKCRHCKSTIVAPGPAPAGATPQGRNASAPGLVGENPIPRPKSSGAGVAAAAGGLLLVGGLGVLAAGSAGLWWWWPRPTTVTIVGASPLHLASRSPVPIRAEVLDQRGQGIPDAKVEWSVADPAVARVDGGELIPITNGSTDLTARSAGAAAATRVEISVPDRVEITVPKDQLVVGQSIQLEARALSGETVLPDATVSWSSADPAIVSIDEAGKATGVKAGECAITATASEVVGSVTLKATAARAKRSGPSVELGDMVDVRGGLDRSDIDPVLKRNFSQLLFCYQQVLPYEASAGYLVDFRFVIAKDGTVSSAKATSGEGYTRPELRSCVVNTQQTPPPA